MKIGRGTPRFDITGGQPGLICAGGQSGLGFSAWGQSGLGFSAGGHSGLGYFCWGTTRLLLVAGSCSLELRPGFRGSPLALRYEKTNSSFSSPSKNPPTPKTNLLHSGTRKVNHRTGRHWVRTNADNRQTNCDSARREREPRKSRKTPHLGQIQHAYRSLTSCCAQKANLTGAAAARKGRKKGSRPLGDSQVAVDNKTKT